MPMNIYFWLCIYEMFMHDCRRCGRSGKFKVSFYTVNVKLSYEKYDEMHWELINLHPDVSVPTQS